MVGCDRASSRQGEEDSQIQEEAGRMKQIKAWLSIGLVGCKRETLLEIDDEADDDDIEEAVKDWAMGRFVYGWKPVEK